MAVMYSAKLCIMQLLLRLLLDMSGLIKSAGYQSYELIYN